MHEGFKVVADRQKCRQKMGRCSLLAGIRRAARSWEDDEMNRKGIGGI